LFSFTRKQEIFRIGDLEVGGQPGELPTVLVGSIFHEGHGIVKDRDRGLFDERRARLLISRQERISKRTGLPCMYDVVAETEQAMKRHIAFVAEHTSSPLLVNAPNARVRIHGLRVAKDLGVLDRVVYDSVNNTLDEAEMEGIRASGVEAAVVQAFNPRFPMPRGMVAVLRGDGPGGGLLERTGQAGITKPLLFAPVLDLPGVGFAALGVRLLKEEFGLPVGTAPVGVVGRSKPGRTLSPATKMACRAAVVSLVQAAGADYVIYGSLNRSRAIFSSCAVVDAAITYGVRAEGRRPRSPLNPLNVMFRRGSRP